MSQGRHVASRTRTGRVNWGTLGLVFGLFLTMSLPVSATDGWGDPNKVWICHLEDHTSSETWSGGGTTLTGDWVLAWNDAMLNGYPNPAQVTYCENPTDYSRDGDPGKLILISVKALGDETDVRGHGAQLTDRISGYPDGYKG